MMINFRKRQKVVAQDLYIGIFGKLLESLPDGLLLVDEIGDIVLVNKQVVTLFGYPKEELLGRKIELLLPERFVANHPAKRNAFFKNPLMRPMGAGLDLWGLRKDGSEFPLDILLSPVEDEGRKLVIASIRDISDRKQLEEKINAHYEQLARFNATIQELAKSEFTEFAATVATLTQKSVTALDTDRVSVWLFNEDRSELICNNLFTLSNSSHEQGACLKKAAFPHYFQAIMDHRTIKADDAQNNPATSEFSETYLQPLGITSMLDTGIFLQSKLIGVVCAEHVGPQREWSEEEIAFLNTIANLVTLSREASERQRAEMELERHKEHLEELVKVRTTDLWEQQQTLRTITSSTRSAILMVDHEGHISFWNEAAVKIFGWSQQEAIGQDLHKLIAPEQYYEQQRKAFSHFRQTGEGALIGKNMEFTAIRKNGEEFPVELAFSGVKKKGEWHAVGILSDVTERKAMEAIKTRQIDELERFSKLAIGREQIMIELKGEINELLKHAGKKEKYKIVK